MIDRSGSSKSSFRPLVAVRPLLAMDGLRFAEVFYADVECCGRSKW
jgi:hypothetical protein